MYKKIELLQRNLKDNESIYYVNFEEKSHLDSDFVAKMKLDEKVKVIKGGFDLSCIINRKILPKEHGTGKIDLMVDKYDTQSLSDMEIAELTYMFKEEARLKNLTIFIAAQPTEIYKTAFKKGEGRSKGQQMLHNIKEIMHSHNLKYIMRTTWKIFTLAKITEYYLNGKPNQYVLNPGNDTSRTKKVRQHYLKKSKLTETGQCFDCQKRVDHDRLCKLPDKPTIKNDKSMYRVVTGCRCNFHPSIGHSIIGLLPKLIRISTSANHLEQLALIAFSLSSIIQINTKRIATLHFESKTPFWLKCLLQIKNFHGLTVTFDAAEFKNLDLDQDQDKGKGQLVLVTDYSSVRGLEFPDVLLLLNENEYYLRYFIPGAMTRCMSNLSILIVPCDKKISQSETVSALVNEWKKVNSRYNNTILELVELKFCSNPSCILKVNDFCEDRENKYIHKFTKFFGDLYEEIQHIFVPNLKSDNEEEKEEAKSL